MFNVSTSGGPDCVLTFAGMSPLGVAGTSVCDKKLDVVVETSGLLSSCAVGEQSKYTLSKRHDLFLTLTKLFWCLNPNQSNIKLNLKVKFQQTCVFALATLTYITHIYSGEWVAVYWNIWKMLNHKTKKKSVLLGICGKLWWLLTFWHTFSDWLQTKQTIKTISRLIPNKTNLPAMSSTSATCSSVSIFIYTFCCC